MVIHMFITSCLWLQAGFPWSSQCSRLSQEEKIPGECNPFLPAETKQADLPVLYWTSTTLFIFICSPVIQPKPCSTDLQDPLLEQVPQGFHQVAEGGPVWGFRLPASQHYAVAVTIDTYFIVSLEICEWEQTYSVSLENSALYISEVL